MSRQAIILNKFGKPFCGYAQVVCVHPSLQSARQVADSLNRQSIAQHVGPFTAAEIEELKVVTGRRPQAADCRGEDER